MFKKTLKVILSLFLIFCVIFTVAGVGVIVTNYNNLGHFIQSYALIENFFLWPPEKADLIEGMIDGMVLSLNDRYSRYFSLKNTKSFGNPFREFMEELEFMQTSLMIL